MTGPTATLRLRYADAARAQKAAAAFTPDDDDYVTTRCEGDHVIVDVRADDVRALLRALDDVLAQVAVSEDILK